MKLTRALILTMFFLSILFHANVSAQDYTQWNLPEGATARLGKGTITGDIQYSPDGKLARALPVLSVFGFTMLKHIKKLTCSSGRQRRSQSLHFPRMEIHLLPEVQTEPSSCGTHVRPNRKSLREDTIAVVLLPSHFRLCRKSTYL